MTEYLMDTKELSQRLGTSAVTLARMRCQGNGPAFIRIGRRVKYRWSNVETWLADRERQSTSEAA